MKIKFSVLMLLILLLLSSSFVFANEGVELTEGTTKTSSKDIDSSKLKKHYQDRLKKILKEEDSEKQLELLKSLLEEVNEDGDLNKLDWIDLDSLQEEINKEIEKIEKVEKEKLSPYTAKEMQSLTKVTHDGRNFKIELPELKRGQEYRYELYKDKKFIEKDFTDDYIYLPKITEEEKFSLKLEIIDRMDGVLLKTDVNVEVKDIPVPSLNYAYIEDGKVTLDFDEDFVLNGKLDYMNKGKRDQIKVVNNTFKIEETPVDIEIILLSPFKKEKVLKLNIEKDNYVISGEVSWELEEKLKEKRIIDLDKYRFINNLFVGEKNKIIDLEKESKHLIFNKFGKTNKEDISFSSDNINIDGSYGELVKEGLNIVKINHSFYSEEELTLFVYVKEDNKVFNTNIDKIEIKGKLITDKETFTARDFIDVKEKIEGYKPVLDFLFVIDENNMAYPIDKEVKLHEGKINTYTIVDVLTNKSYNLNLKHKETKPEEKDRNVSFSDVKGNHWAYHDIKELAFKGIINGYEDGTYKPNNKITVKEFIVLLNRTISKSSSLEVENFKNDFHIPLSKDDWSYIDVFSIYRKVDTGDMHKISINNINRHITRGEVAFLVDASIKLNGLKEGGNFSDIDNSIYKGHIKKLTDSNIIKGYSDNTFKPNGKITRAEASSILNRLLKINKGEI